MADLGRCPFTCPTCHRRCNGAGGPLSHRFDCCGIISAHDVVTRPVGKRRESSWRRFENPTRAGYLTGPSTTTPSKENA